MKQVYLYDFLDYATQPSINLKLVNIRGCNGSGKSTVPHQMLKSDKSTFEIVWVNDAGRLKVIATVFPAFKFLALGHYHTQAGGMDTIGSTQEIKLAVELFWNTNYHILMEGILASTVRGTYIDLFQSLNQSHSPREIIIYNILPPLNVCLQRIQARNGGKSIKEELVANKWKIVQRNVAKFADSGFNSLSVDNSTIPIEQTLDWFFNNIGVHFATQAVSCAQTPTDINPHQPSDTPLIQPDIDSIKDYPWFEDFKMPNDQLVIDQKYFDSYWNFIAERMNIWYRRVMLNQPAPWTDDPILQNFKFTNAIRDLDKLSIYERKHILSKIDEMLPSWSADKILKWKQSILLNIMIFRLWVKIDTYEIHGFINLSNPFWRTDWEMAKQILLQRREQGISNFTAAYYVNDLRAVNPDPNTKSNKTQNAICMIDYWANNIDSIYQNAIVNSKNMKEQIAYFKTLPCVGGFTAYEYACSITEITRYCKNHLVSWTQDNATNVGPGAQRGINWIFKNKGGMSDYQCILYLRSIWKQALQQQGTYDRFIAQLPAEMNGDIDLRVIEHCLCETQKYNKAWTNTGRPKETFKPHTTNMDELKVKNNLLEEIL